MGGYGSGGHNRKYDGFVDMCDRLDAITLMRKGVLRRGWLGRWGWESSDRETRQIFVCGGTDSIHLRYQVQRDNDDWQSIDETIQLYWSPRHFGDAQVYFQCPSCSRTCRYLYGGGPRFLCRECHNLTYRSSVAGNAYRTILGVQRLRAQIGASARLWSEIPERPRYMRRSKYDSIVQRIAATEETALRDMIRVAKELGIDVGDGCA